jgi:nitroimidazol reductase NimA-like FMN-containing flavoprotein (pyridoxamine 5'-phosphate oxidase superfamily)
VKPLPDSVREFIRSAPVCRIATAHPNVGPHVIPVCPIFDGDSTLYVDIGPDSRTAQALESDGRIAVLIDEYYDDWSKLKAALLYCRPRPVEGEEQDRAWAMIREKFPQYTTVDWEPRLTLALEIQDWRQWGVSA